MSLDKAEVKQVPMNRELNELREIVSEAHSLFSKLHSRIDVALVHVPVSSSDSNGLNKTCEQNCSELVNEIRVIKTQVKELCSKIEDDLLHIEI